MVQVVESGKGWKVTLFLIISWEASFDDCFILQVVQSPVGLEIIHGLWLQFYKRAKRQLWTMEDKPLFACWEDIVKRVEEPLLSMCGSRIYYKFWQFKELFLCGVHHPCFESVN